MPNIVICGLTPVILIGALVMRAKPAGPDFWPRLVWYAIGLLVGVSLVFLAVHLLNVGARDYHKVPKPHSMVD